MGASESGVRTSLVNSAASSTVYAFALTAPGRVSPNAMIAVAEKAISLFEFFVVVLIFSTPYFLPFGIFFKHSPFLRPLSRLQLSAAPEKTRRSRSHIRFQMHPKIFQHEYASVVRFDDHTQIVCPLGKSKFHAQCFL